ncbi:5-carboxymethyl-2-hydroxymuconate Delta-isomerase [Ferribacterium limneticum]|uniref:5-carboxymethyl-2-hydroxymuconate Delta-isomerase n=1 Tax=Ferribacterium limneticum TaxID=76259 RepID=UPI001CF8D0F3|nr:5-carboxymethyl-2-hydroxymuconate Delta-isomerase [Ferribacterium limneticum]UCV22658.1 5-carboxymethyl-2-hydroxymuconate Delta-isomerase [Ferribacterium limneticum]
MPHLTLEYTRNLSDFDPTVALAAINAAAFDSGLFGEPDIKSRAIGLDCFQIGVLPGARGFIHIRIALLAGRSDEERQHLAEAVLAALNATVNRKKGMEIQLSVETVDLDRASYAKAVIDG